MVIAVALERTVRRERTVAREQIRELARVLPGIGLARRDAMQTPRTTVSSTVLPISQPAVLADWVSVDFDDHDLEEWPPSDGMLDDELDDADTGIYVVTRHHDLPSIDDLFDPGASDELS
jgi:hypothetical protein